MKRSPSIMSIPLILSTLATMFCIWTFTHKSTAFCFTAGCSLFKDANIAGFSPWQIAAGFFIACVTFSIFRLPGIAYLLSGLALSVDLILLIILLFTAPCSNCLIVGIFFLLVYLSFRREAIKEFGLDGIFSRKIKRISLLGLIWGFLFLLNATSVIKAELGVWCISDNASEARIHMYFSPSCSACKQGISKLSGRIDVAFFPVAEHEHDVPIIEGVVRCLDAGLSIDEAVQKSSDLTEKDAMPFWHLDSLLLRFRLARNKAHILLAGSNVVPFLEYHGLPKFLADRKTPSQEKKGQENNNQPASRSSKDVNDEEKSPILPLEGGVFGFCQENEPCNDGQQPSWTTKRP